MERRNFMKGIGMAGLSGILPFKKLNAQIMNTSKTTNDTPVSGIFKNDFLNGFGTWSLGYIPFGGIDYGEIQGVALATGDGDEGAYYEAWMNAGNRFVAEADETFQNGRPVIAKELYLKASECYAAAFHPIYGSPVDQRLLAAFSKQVESFDKAMALSNPPVKSVRIPFENTSMPGYFIPAEGYAGKKRPVIIFTNGYDGVVTDMYFASAAAASKRGYHCFLFDGPGQGEMLYKQNIPLRADWETVITAVVDFVIKIKAVDVNKIILNGWSLGGYLALRGASGEPRLAACISDPGLSDVGAGFRKALLNFGATPQQAADPANLDQSILDRMMQYVENNRSMKWSIIQRGFWVNGVDNLRDFLVKSYACTLDGRIDKIKCPTLLTASEHDRLNTIESVEAFFNQLQCPKQLLKFYADRGAADHCEMNNRSLVNRRVLDWLDTLLMKSNSNMQKVQF